jgi:DNA replication protein DnaC
MAEAPTANGEEGYAVCALCGREFPYRCRYVINGTAVFRIPAPDICEACQETETRKDQEEERQRTFEAAMQRYRDGDRGSRLAQASFADYLEADHNRAAMKTAQAWVQATSRPNLLIVGPIQSGKSYLAACVYNALLAAYEPAYWLNAASLVAKIRRGFGDREAAAEANGRIERAERAPILVLDDLGKVHPGKDVSWVEETFYAIVEARYRDELPTIVTTEWKSEALAERVGPSVVSRLEDGAWVTGLRQPDGGYRRPAKVTR